MQFTKDFLSFRLVAAPETFNRCLTITEFLRLKDFDEAGGITNLPQCNRGVFSQIDVGKIGAVLVMIREELAEIGNRAGISDIPQGVHDARPREPSRTFVQVIEQGGNSAGATQAAEGINSANIVVVVAPRVVP